jgi:hypothetical protein
LGKRSERIAAHDHGLDEIAFSHVNVAAIELILVGVGDGVEQKIERAPG